MSATHPLFSIVIPTCRGPAVLQTCLNAVLKMEDSGRNVEVIVVNDGGPRLLKKNLSGGEKAGIRILNQKQLGAAAARNAGARVARGMFLVFLDDDCRPTGKWLKIMAQKAKDRPPTALGGQMVNASIKDPYAAATQGMIDTLYSVMNEDYFHARFLTSSNFVVPRNAFLNLGGFDEGYEGAGGEDRDFCRRWIHAGYEMIFVPEAVVVHAHESSPGHFLRQHFGYGKGAFGYYRGGRGFPGDGKGFAGFYLELLRSPVKCRPMADKLLLECLMIVSQIATGAGFLAAWFMEVFGALRGVIKNENVQFRKKQLKQHDRFKSAEGTSRKKIAEKGQGAQKQTDKPLPARREA